MKRRQFISLSALASLAVISPLSLQAEDFRQTKASAWTAHTVDDAIKSMYGDISVIEEGVVLGAPNVASNGATIPIEISSDIDAKSVALFQDANPEATVIAYTVYANSIIDYSSKIKMQEGPGTITVIIEGKDGKYYSARKTIRVAGGGCDP